MGGEDTERCKRMGRRTMKDMKIALMLRPRMTTLSAGTYHGMLLYYVAEIRPRDNH